MKNLIVFNWRVVSLLAVIFLLTACGANENNSNDRVESSLHNKSNTALHTALLKEYQYWAGSPFRLGGSSLKGIDCSSLVQQVYKKSANISLPRTTESQAENGYEIKKSQLQVGDLVFFKTGWKVRHVGIYMGNNEFFHASTSKGVIVSNLNNPYWKEHYWHSRRVN